ncbi:sensor histidine kinase [Fischerella thermalis]|uniref:histidine kinase n=1 Tax=Fischerella thermalis JSC-11 TaxID=741277 RepID=G6FNF0_9CYAN|nr:ATP-binding protein [Fischerella thermalis]EHC19580.1 multi-sensor signal transduction histidine kinase [Fischerella thermalis JSC-11]PLZ09083.1 cyanobacterial phytochrome A [Fischerella thermalis WC114]PLZ09466.1 cyanobacterial phytochrome A [Fischerella thermalis WC1110]PLZ18684.1 cyanobacterial phytochrome A [Fischerella thermalis WC157]PLZ26199.1 cyanobacterial phytochrome A [Fischerella thermalis WC341]
MVMEFELQSLNLTSLKEPSIHNISQIQPHGVLLVLEEPELNILQVSSNTYDVFGITPENMLQKKLEDLLDPFQIEKIKAGLLQESLDMINPTKIWARVKGDEYIVFDGIFHRNADGLLILELELAFSQENIPFLSFYHLARASINKLEETGNLHDFCQILVQEVRKVTGFDRVMLYKFDDDGHGSVIAEEKLETMESYLGLHYPESDIPRPARKLFASNWIRIIPDTHADPVEIFPAINPLSQRRPDLTNSILRSPYSCHIEYLHNMGVGASLTISLIKEGKLWGLIACHHQTPKYVSYEMRKACEFLGRVIFSELADREETEDYDYRMRLTYIQSALVEYMSQEENFIDGLVKHQPNLLDLTNAQGAAICFGGNYTLIGETPKEEDLNFLVQWLKNNVEEEVFYTDSLPRLYPDAQNFKNVASGLLAIPISKQNYVLWFRPEVIQTVNWGGDPNRAFEVNTSDGNTRLCPRKSFELWKETVRLTSLRWQAVEVKAALELRKAIVNIVLRQADELAQLAHDLELSNAELKKFAYVASHDLQEPLNQVANYVQLLEMRYEQLLDEDAKEFISFAVEGVSLMQTLIDDVLAYSKVDMQAIEFELTNVETALERALTNLRKRISETGAVITHDQLPTVMADGTQLMQLFQNLIGNAIKFRSDQAPEIHIGASRLEDEWLFSVRDNGIGIDPQFRDRIFVIFQRLHTRDEYPGTGMGLAICKKIIECHRGRIWVESKLGEGATFYFTIPVGGRDRERRNGRKAQNHIFGRR